MKRNIQTITVQDLIILGICFIFYFFIFLIVVHMAVMLTPLTYPFISVFLALFEGVVYLLLVTKAPKFGIITIFSVLLSVTIMLFGHGSYVLIGPIFGCSADLVLKNHHRQWKYQILSYAIFSLWVMSITIQLYLFVDAFNRDPTFAKMGTKFTQSVMQVMSVWNLPIVLITTLLGAVLGIYWGRTILHKVSVLK
ncbi:MAG: MptD family putative ECF transporter S component [Neisseriaceae bacterium]|nr:MAG: MptD family putative ECF transporter S component [Neisseriaceae bacterium]